MQQTAAAMLTLQDQLPTHEMPPILSAPLFGEVQELRQCLSLVLTSQQLHFVGQMT